MEVFYSFCTGQIKKRGGWIPPALYIFLSLSPWSPASRKCPPIRLFNVVWRGNEFWKIAGAICQDVMLRQLIWGMVKAAWENRRGTAGEGRPVTAQTQLGRGSGRREKLTFYPLFTHQSSDAMELGEANLSRSVMQSRKQLADMGVCVDAGWRKRDLLLLSGAGAGAPPPPVPVSCLED